MLKQACVPGLIGLSLLLAGCGSSDQDARDELNGARLSQSRSPQLVQRASRQVSIKSTTLLRDAKSTAVVVELRSTADKPLTDIPITVGVRRSGKEISFNAAGGLDWFRTHVPAIPAKGSAVWIFQAPTNRRVPSGQSFARVGNPDPELASAAEEKLPKLAASWAPAGGTDREPRFFVANKTEIPQANVPVYAFARADGEYVAAGTATIPDLPAETTRSVAIRLAGSPGTEPPSVVAAATSFK